MAEHRVIVFPAEQFAQSAARPPRSPGPAEAHWSEHVHRHTSRDELVAHAAFETECEVRLHVRAQMAEIRERGKQRFDAPIEVARVQMQNPRRLPFAWGRCLLDRSLA